MSIADKILGKEKLKRKIGVLEDRLESLKEEKERLKEQADKDRKRAKEAISEKQNLHEKINRQQDKIESLKGRLNQEEMVRNAVESKEERHRLGRKDLRSLLTKLGSMGSDREDMFSIYLPPGMPLGKLDREGSLRSEMKLSQLQRLKDIDSRTGKIMFYCEGLVEILIKPPLPIEEETWKSGNSFLVEPLEEQLEESEIGLVFLSAGGSGVARFNGDVKTVVVKSSIKGKHSKGGFSQDRFSRLRDEQVEEHLDEVEEAMKELWSETPEYVVLSGSQEMRKKFQDRNVELFSEAVTFEKPMDFSKVTNQEGMERVASFFWKTEVTQI
ncbi:MAG: Vms1/Ankzf1 family peptidyl-tRNA hydrolase [Candidatus Aenigmatarchaeota archaeon]